MKKMPTTYVIKRNGKKERFKLEKLNASLQNAFSERELKDVPEEEIINCFLKIGREVNNLAKDNEVLKSEEIRKIVIKNLKDSSLEIYQNFNKEEPILKDSFLKKYKDKQPNWGFNGLGYIIYKRTYAREVPGENRHEEWWETVRRCVEWLYATHKQMNIDVYEGFYEEIFDVVFNLKANFSGRLLWQAGTRTVDKIGGASMNNCWALIMDNKKSFMNMFDYLMLGGGVGFNIQKKYVNKLPKIKKGVEIYRNDEKSADFIVPDTREGWIKLFGEVLESYFETGDSFNYSLQLIRSSGAKINGFGGTASGPEPLHQGIKKICQVFKKREGKKLRPIDVLDIVNIVGEIVVSGNVRRSAQIAVGDIDDKNFLSAKMWEKGVPNHRAMSNNTIVCDDIKELGDSFWRGYEINPETGQARSEPYGLFNKNLSRKKGRISDDHRKDPLVNCLNPCAEITLAPTEDNGGAEACNLCEIYLNNIKDEKELLKVVKIMYIAVKTVTLLKYHHKETNKIIKKNSRLGVSLTGIVQREDLIKPSILNKVYKALEELDKDFSEENNISESIKLTTVKPSGTLSLLAGSTPGVHPAYSRCYIRRLRISSNNPLLELCKKAGLKTEFQLNFDGTQDKKTTVVEFPVKLSEDTKVAKDMTAIQQLELVKHMQKYWADNSVSVTVYYKEKELPEIRKWLEENYNENIKSISFLLHQEHGFQQAPYEEITEEKYEEINGNIKNFDFNLLKFSSKALEDLDNSECASGHCPIR